MPSSRGPPGSRWLPTATSASSGSWRVPAIAHSAFELWLLPARLLDWCRSHPEFRCSPLLVAEVRGFMALHAILIVGFLAALLAKGTPRDGAARPLASS